MALKSPSFSARSPVFRETLTLSESTSSFVIVAELQLIIGLAIPAQISTQRYLSLMRLVRRLVARSVF